MSDPCQPELSARRNHARGGMVARPGAGRSPLGTRAGGARAFTLAEVMVAATVFAMVTLGVYTMLLKSYQLSALTRCRDDARGVLRTYADQFERLSTTVKDEDGITRQRWLFLPSSATGRGLVWGALSDGNTSVNAEDVASLPITLGGSGHAVAATLTREVHYVQPTTTGGFNAGQSDSTVPQTIEAAGYMLSGTFTISYSLNSRRYTQSVTVVRAAP